MLQPYYIFEPLYIPKIWGGSRIAAFKGLDCSRTGIGESWETADMGELQTVVASGPDKGLTIAGLCQRYEADFVGTRPMARYGAHFPLLIKFIDAQSDLSVQVHPDDHVARRDHDAHGKSEMWYVVEAAPDAKIYSGFSRQVSAAELAGLVADGSVMSVIASHRAKAGDVFFLPAGRIHAIGAGVMLVEIQQPSDITYRIYDYGRPDSDGRPRTLHVDRAMQALDFATADDYSTAYDRTADHAALTSCEHFSVELMHLQPETDGIIKHDGASCTAVVCIEGSFRLPDGTEVGRGHTVVIPAASADMKLTGRATLIVAKA